MKKKRQIFELFANTVIQKLLKHLLITEYTVTLRYEKKLKSVMEINVDHEYLEAEIAYGKSTVNRFMTEPDYVEETIFHEVMHIITTRLTDERKGLSKKKFLKVEEQTNEHLAKAFYKLVRRL